MKRTFLIALSVAVSTAAHAQFSVPASDATKVYTTGPDSSHLYADVIAYNGSNPGFGNADFSVVDYSTSGLSLNGHTSFDGFVVTLFESPYGNNHPSDFNAWVVPNTTAALHSNPSLKFDKTAGASGYSGQLGTADFVGKFHYTNVSGSKDVFTLVPDAAALTLLDTQVVAGKVRLLYDSVDATTNTGYYGYDPGYTDSSQLAFNSAAPSPEPAPCVAFGLGLAALALRKRRN